MIVIKNLEKEIKEIKKKQIDCIKRNVNTDCLRKSMKIYS